MAQKIWQSKGVRWIGLGWTAFIAENLILSHHRTEIIDNFGNDTYHQFYNTLSGMACASIAWGYFRHGRMQGPMMAMLKRSPVAIAAGTVLQTIGFIGFSQMAPKVQLPVDIVMDKGEAPVAVNGATTSTAAPTTTPLPKIKYAARCPMDFKPPNIPLDGIYGTERVTRYPMLWSLGLASVGNALTTVFYTEVVMFTFPLIFAGIGSLHQDFRYRRGLGGYLSPEKEEKTSNIPFQALIMGKQSWEDLNKEMKWTNAALAAACGLFLGVKRLAK